MVDWNLRGQTLDCLGKLDCLGFRGQFFSGARSVMGFVGDTTRDTEGLANDGLVLLHLQNYDEGARFTITLSLPFRRELCMADYCYFVMQFQSLIRLLHAEVVAEQTGVSVERRRVLRRQNFAFILRLKVWLHNRGIVQIGL